MTLFYIGAGVGYLYWRALYTLNTGALAVSLPFLFADIAGFGYFLLFAHNLWRWTERKPSPPPPGRAVDVFIPTYNEDINVLRPTIEAALAMDYPHATYVLDDGRRDEVRRLCEQLGATYLTRDTNDGAKAGNINAALPRTSGEFIAFFDADHAPFRNFLTELLGYFEDPTVALVQTPQAYYNLDSFQHGGSAPDGSARPWHEQSVFYDVMMPGKDRFNAAFWCGSSAVLRRSALESIGGVDTRTVTEDMHTSMGLHAAGWRSVYDPRELAIGIAPHDASGFLVQRSRWARGALQILRHDNPLTRPGLRWNQRLAYFAAVAYVFEYIPRLIYLLTPIACLLVGQLPMRSVAWTTLTFVIAFWALGLLTSRLLTRGRNPYLDAERYHLLKLTVMLQACFTYLWSRPHKFNVTPKAGDGSDHFAASMSLILVQLAIGWLSVLAIAWAGLAYFTGAPWQLKGESLVVTAAWALLNAGLVALLTRSIFQHHHRRKVYRFNVQAAGTIQCDDMAGPARILDLSAAGVGWESAVPAAPGKIANLRFVLAGQEIAAGVTVLTRRYDGTKFRYGGEFATLSAEDARHLILYLYQRHAPAIFHGQHAVLAQHANDADSLPLAS